MTMIRWIFAFLLVANALPALLFGLPAAEQPSGKSVPSTPAGAESLQLLRERDGEPAQRRPGPAASTCVRIGPVPGSRQAQALADRLRAEALQPQSLWRETESGADYWVYLPARPSPRATTRVLRELQANGMDSYVFSEGELKGAISLGVYGSQEAAREQRQRFERLGYEASVAAMTRKRREYWLLVPGTNPRAEELASSIAAEAGYAAKNLEAGCKTVASGAHFP